MKIACLDLEGTLTPEIWEQVAKDTGIDDFMKTTRDIPQYDDLMDYRIKLMKENKLTLSDIKHSIGKMDLLDGAQMFLQNIRKYFQVVILSDTFYEFAMPLMSKMDFPLLLCHKLNVGDLEQIEGYDLRHSKAKKQAIEAFNQIGYKCIAAGDSYNDTQMFEVAEHGFFINAPSSISSQYPHIPSFSNYNDLLDAFYSVKDDRK